MLKSPSTTSLEKVGHMVERFVKSDMKVDFVLGGL